MPSTILSKLIVKPIYVYHTKESIQFYHYYVTISAVYAIIQANITTYFIFHIYI